ncbi:MAG TPA: murein transglycosylase A [Rhizomicrobium sp.]|nr:murein transglycosylase A [Rhizomicrobium sp.]
MRRWRLAAQLLAALLVLAACTTAPPSPSGLRFTKAGFTQLPQWSAANDAAALLSFQRSCAVLMAKPDTTAMGGAGYAGTVGDWRQVCAAANGDARRFFETNFTPFAVGGAQSLFTGYYEPEIRGSRGRQGAFQTPVYGLPSDLVRVDLGQFNAKFQGEHVSGKVQGHALVPYADRAEINAKGAATAPVLFYTDDPIALFFLQIQGSGRVVFADGSMARVAYAGENGQAYTAIGRSLIADGSLTREEVSLQSIRAWLKANPDQARAVMETNRSYIFFAEAPLEDPALGPQGSLGAHLTPLASIAVDARLHALGVPFYVAAEGGDPVHALTVAQDIGGAIRGPVRADIFFGFGPEAERRAGAMKGTGALYVLLPKALAAKIGDSKSYPP